MSFDFSTLITDRSPEDLQTLRNLLATPMADWTAEQLAQFNQAVSKGAYNYTDLNRVTACMDYLNERLTALGYVTGYHPIIVHPETPPTPTIPEGYTELEYIESSGIQYIDTGFIPDQATKVDLDFQMVGNGNVWQCVFGERQLYANIDTFSFWLDPSNNFLVYFGNSHSGFPEPLDFGVRHTLTMDGNTANMDGQTISQPLSSFTGPYPITIFAINEGTLSSFSTCKLYQFRLYDNGTLVRDYLPCKNQNGEVCLYDQVSGESVYSLGAGSFIGGPEIPHPEPLDPYTWYEEDDPTATQMQRYLANVAALRGALALPEDTVGIPGDMTGLTQDEANAIEDVLGILEGWIQNMAAAWFYSGDLYAGEV